VSADLARSDEELVDLAQQVRGESAAARATLAEQIGARPQSDEALWSYVRDPLPAPSGARYDLVAHLRRQRDFSLRTFGPGPRAAGVCDHIRRELLEVEAAPADVVEWIDVALLAFDGALRAGHEPEEVAEALRAKLARNEVRTWPDWRRAAPGRAIEHVREA
jgi:hypothetical protein